MPPARKSPDIVKMIKYPEINPVTMRKSPEILKLIKFPEIRASAEKIDAKVMFSSGEASDVKIRVENRILYVNREILCKHAFGFLKILQEKKNCTFINLPSKRFDDIYELLQCIVRMKTINEYNAFRLAPLVNEYLVTNLHRDVDRVVSRYIDSVDLADEEMVDLLLFSIENNLPETIRKTVLHCAFISTQQCDKLILADQKKYKSVVFYLLHIVKQQIDTYRRQQTHKILYNVVYWGNRENKKCDRCAQNGRLFYCQICKKYFCPVHCAGCENFCTHCNDCQKEIPPKFINKFEPGSQYCFCAVRLSNKMIGRLVRSNIGEKFLKI